MNRRPVIVKKRGLNLLGVNPVNYPSRNPSPQPVSPPNTAISPPNVSLPIFKI